MKDNVTNNKYDLILNTLFINLYTLSKDKGKIELKGFNITNEAHWVILNIANNLK